MSISPHLEPMAVTACQSRQLAVCAIREVVQVMARDQVLGVHVGAILSWKEIESGSFEFHPLITDITSLISYSLQQSTK